MKIICSNCHTPYPLDTRDWACKNCGGLFEIAGTSRIDPLLIDTDNTTLWRYRPFLPLPEQAKPISMGEGFTPLVETQLDGITFFSKLDFLNPTGSFKDRGTTVLVSAIKSFGVTC